MLIHTPHITHFRNNRSKLKRKHQLHFPSPLTFIITIINVAAVTINTVIAITHASNHKPTYRSTHLPIQHFRTHESTIADAHKLFSNQYGSF